MVNLKTTTVSVVIAAHNASGFIEDALQSALCQRGVDLEVIVVDDGSSDDTLLTLNDWASGDKRLRVLRSTVCGGPSAARNIAIGAARGEWLAILDSDDAMASDRLQRMVLEAESLRCDLLADNLQLIDFASRKKMGLAFDSSWMNDRQPLSLKDLLQKDWPGQHNGMGIGFIKPIIRRNFLTRHNLCYDADIRTGEDILLYARLIDAGGKAYLQPEAGYFFSVRSGSLSSKDQSTMDLVEVNRRISMLGGASVSGLDFHQRNQAIWYQQLSTSLKRRRISASLIAASHLRPYFLIKQFGRALKRRLIARS